MKLTEESFSELTQSEAVPEEAAESFGELTQSEAVSEETVESFGELTQSEAVPEETVESFGELTQSEAVPEETVEHVAELPAESAPDEAPEATEPERARTAERVQRAPRRKRHSLLYWISGGLIERFINSRWVMLVVWIFFLFFCNVALGYWTISQTKQISRLESELELVRNRQLFIEADLTRLTREETIMMRLKAQNSTLTEKEEQPFVLYYDGAGKK